jgi:hypothetical protein
MPREGMIAPGGNGVVRRRVSGEGEEDSSAGS